MNSSTPRVNRQVLNARLVCKCKLRPGSLEKPGELEGLVAVRWAE